MRILQMMSFLKTPEQLANLENAISQYFAKKADEELDMLCENGTITLDTIEKWGRSTCVFQENEKIVLDTNCLLMSLPKISPYF